MKPEWVTKLKSEPCQCVRCNDCGGNGTIYFDWRGRYVGRNRTDDLDEPQSCDTCSGGIVETCDRCEALHDYEMSLP